MKLSELPVGSKIKFGKYQVETEEPEVICWLVADQNHEGYPDNSTTLITEKIIDLRAFDAKEPNNEDADRQKYGNNRWLYANINQWLNSDQNNWYVAKYEYDAPPVDSNINYETGYDNKTGFLNLFNDNEKSLILDTNLITQKNTVTDNGDNETSISKVFFLSAVEVGMPDGSNVEGSELALFSKTSIKAYLTDQCYNNTKSTIKPANLENAWSWWLRTPSPNDSYNVRYIVSLGSGSLSNAKAYDGDTGIRPALNISSFTSISDTPDSDGYYTIIYPSFDISNFKKIAIVGDGELENMQTAIETNTSNISALADKIGSTQASANANSYDILTVIMALKDDWAGDIIGPGMYMDCLTDESTFTVTDGIYDSNNSYIYVN